MGRDCGLYSVLSLWVLKDFKKHNDKLEKKGTSWCSGTLFDFWGAVLEKSRSLPSAKVVHGQQMTSFQICDHLWPRYITYSRKIFPCIYVPTFNPMFKMSDFWTAKPINSWIETPQHYQIIPQNPQIFVFSLKSIPREKKHWWISYVYTYIFFFP